MKLESAEDVFNFWFGEDLRKQNNLGLIQGRFGIWFGNASTEFNEIQRENKELIDFVSNSSESSLPAEWLTPEGIIARVILMDQFPRSVYRGTAKAFQYDPIVQRIIRDLASSGEIYTSAFTVVERFFMGVALQHSELLEDQQLGIDISIKMTAGANSGFYF